MKVLNLISKDYILLTNEISGDFVFAGIYVSDLLSNVLRQAKPENGLITTLANMNTIAVASMLDLKLVLFCEGRLPSIEMISKADEEGIALVSTSKTAVEVILELHQMNVL